MARQSALKFEDRAFDFAPYLKEDATIEPAYVSASGALFLPTA